MMMCERAPTLAFPSSQQPPRKPSLNVKSSLSIFPDTEKPSPTSHLGLLLAQAFFVRDLPILNNPKDDRTLCIPLISVRTCIQLHSHASHQPIAYRSYKRPEDLPAKGLIVRLGSTVPSRFTRFRIEEISKRSRSGSAKDGVGKVRNMKHL
jgi:hypothetical protein